jgi:hypothetical protein
MGPRPASYTVRLTDLGWTLTCWFAAGSLGRKFQVSEVGDPSVIDAADVLQEGGVLGAFEGQEASVEIAGELHPRLIRGDWILCRGDHHYWWQPGDLWMVRFAGGWYRPERAVVKGWGGWSSCARRTRSPGGRSGGGHGRGRPSGPGSCPAPRHSQRGPRTTRRRHQNLVGGLEPGQ